MKKVSKVKAVNNGFNAWEKDGVQYFPHLYTMEDETVIKANHKVLNPFAVGAEVEYEVKGNEPNGNAKGSVGKAQQQNAQYQQASTQTPKSNYVPADQDAILYQVCLKIAGEIQGQSITNNTPKQVNDYAMEVAIVAKLNIAKLKLLL